MTLNLIYTGCKILFTATLIVTISEVAKRNNLLAALLASIPLTSLLAIFWLYLETKNTQAIITLSYEIFWLVLPSLVFFLVLPYLLQKNWGFYYASGTALLATIGSYSIMGFILQQLKVAH